MKLLTISITKTLRSGMEFLVKIDIYHYMAEFIRVAIREFIRREILKFDDAISIPADIVKFEDPAYERMYRRLEKDNYILPTRRKGKSVIIAQAFDIPVIYLEIIDPYVKKNLERFPSRSALFRYALNEHARREIILASQMLTNGNDKDYYSKLYNDERRSESETG